MAQIIPGLKTLYLLIIFTPFAPAAIARIRVNVGALEQLRS
jgi:hypothetical protein